jgi:hypothetical protein
VLLATDVHLFVTVYELVYAYCYSVVLKIEALCEDAGVIKGRKKRNPNE